MNDILEFREGQVYPKDTQYAVRYGYLYRKEAEKYEDGHCHASLGESPELLLWVANAVIGGVVYDVIKSAVKKLYQRIVGGKNHIDKTTEAIFTDEYELEVFCTYIMEFHKHRITANGKQKKYIREEIIADYVGFEVCAITKNEIDPTIEDYKVIVRKAQKLADDLIESDEKG